MNNFIIGRIKAIYYSIKGAFLLLKTEHSIQAQTIISLFFIALGFYFDISKNEWIFQILAISLVLVAESLNTAIEKLSDYIQPKFDKKIGFIKDIAAGSVFFAAIFALFIVYAIYWDKIL